ncbi:MAG: M1 family metallopeptidase [Nocardioidaceae bacterium]
MVSRLIRVASVTCVAAVGLSGASAAPGVPSRAAMQVHQRHFPDAAAGVDVQPPSQGIGDPYYPLAGNAGYDARHYDIQVRYHPASRVIEGVTRIRLTAGRRLERFNLDLLLPARAVRVAGVAARFHQGRHELTVTPRRAVRRGQSVTVQVAYGGRPLHRSYGGETPFEQTATGALAVGEPQIAPWWFPSNDHPSDKATFTIRLTVPAGYEALSNGALANRRSAAGLSTWTWAVRSQMATYLAFAAFGHYDVERGRTAQGVPFVYGFERGLGHHARAARTSVRSTPEVLRFLERAWGSYPYRNLGGVVPAVSLGYALENQTRPVYGRDMFSYGVDRGLVAHELAHQWFGDRIAVHRWRHIWLSEGYATYSEWLYARHRGGTTPQRQLRLRYDNLEASNPFWRLTIGDPGRARLFDEAVYDRGAMTLQALRNRIGTPAFFRLSRIWVHGNADGLGSTAEFSRLAERVSMQQLDGFFKAWLRTGAKPRATAANGL